jgi:hypothetical protein
VRVPPGLDPASVHAVFLDLDGTVLERARASAAVAPAIARLQASGVQCVIATGRMLTSARRYAAQFGITAPLVCYQGAMIGDPQTGDVLRHEPIPRDTARELVGAIRDAGHDPLAFVDEGVYVSVESEIARQYSISAGVPYEVVGDLASWIPAPVTKLVTAGEPAQMDALREALLPEFGARAFIAKSLPYYLEAAAPGVSKASGAAYVCTMLGFEAERCVAIGDGENDIELLHWAGYAIGVAGGHGPLLEQADWVCPPVSEDGVPRTLEAIAEARE